MTKKKKPEDLLKVGRPSMYTPELADRICSLVATSEMGYDRLAKLNPDIPERITVNLWRRKFPEFAANYMKAKCDQIEFLTEEILEIADHGKNDYMENLDKTEGCPSWKVNGEHIARSRLRIDTRKWLAAKLVPRLYGEKKIEEISTADLHEDTMKRKQEMADKYKKEF